jgi:prepilin-type N-terminal cleavage/methylation domain-containing protein
MLNDLKFRARRGFSLLELMIVVVLIAGILAITWPSIARPMRKAELSEATQKLREAIEDGRYQAMVSGEPVFLQITQGDSQMRRAAIRSGVRFWNFWENRLRSCRCIGSQSSAGFGSHIGFLAFGPSGHVPGLEVTGKHRRQFDPLDGR